MRIVLASASPRRRELLEQIGLEFEVLVSNVPEQTSAGDPRRMVEELSAQKAEAVFRLIAGGLTALEESTVCGGPAAGEELLVVGADTVVQAEGSILGKPADREDAAGMLAMLSGNSHEVYTGVTLIYRSGSGQIRRKSFYERTEVVFYPMSRAEIERYVSTGDCMDKAGAYGIQGFCARYIREIRGDYSNVVGLPVGRLYQEMKNLRSKEIMGDKLKKAVIFDLDGTLSDSIASIKYCADRAIAPFGYGPFPESEYKYFIGDGAANLIRRALAASGDRESVHFDEAFTLYKKYFARDCMYQVKPYDGIPELLAALKKRKIRIAVLSNKPHDQAVDVVESLFGKGYFDVIRGQKEGAAIKPDPVGVFEILDELSLTAEDILYLGDTATDMKTGKSAGAFTLGALWGFRDRRELEESHADAVIGSPLELLEYI